MKKIVSWNINSIRIRTDLVENFLKKVNPDVLLLQEIKCLNEEFPDCFNKHGYKVITNGEKGKYGVAILVKNKIKINKLIIKDKILEKEARIVGINIEETDIFLINVYAPNGNPIENTEKFNFKIEWLDRLKKLCKNYVLERKNLIVGGDFNVIENYGDAREFNKWKNDALGHIEIRKKFRELLSIGLLNSVRLFHKPGSEFSFWDYQRSSWERNDGILIDHFLISPTITKSIKNMKIDNSYRGLKKPSDHVPIWIDLEL